MKELELSRQPRNRCGAQAGTTGLLILAGMLTCIPLASAGEYVLDRIETQDGTIYESTSTPTTRP